MYISKDPETRIIETLCKLEDGRIVAYDACADSEDAYSPDEFCLIGSGYIWSIGGVVQQRRDAPRTQFFFVRVVANGDAPTGSEQTLPQRL